ncbi:hypothetical protein JJJ17_05200 [Paracoccus caeni]|uniref:Lysozyme inhibitor LprI N-terminal domain-containing protein n=1 Tax=Paracoccus caeni TaxID=657651 RepID=A0A934SCQ8_9RHOB|nr:hypothetical protein [Paracoccus caeni]MBK4215318.1 hypothetical protein [Paracoccus caeni]
MKKHYVNLLAVSICVTLPGAMKADENRLHDVAAIESCLLDQSDRNIALAHCTGTIVKTCRDDQTSSATDMDCTDRETEAWVAVYEQSRDSLLRSARLQRIDGAMDALHQSISEFEASLYRSCPFAVGQWPAEALLRRLSSFDCVRDAEAQRAVEFHFWDRDIRHLSGQ